MAAGSTFRKLHLRFFALVGLMPVAAWARHVEVASKCDALRAKIDFVDVSELHQPYTPSRPSIPRS